MTSDELLTEARKFLATPNLGKSMMRELDKAMIYVRRLADALEASVARIAELEAQVKDFKCEQVFRISEMQELVEAQARIAELESKLAAVPDAATAESERRAWAIAGHLERDREAVKAERDAALEAIERVRAEARAYAKQPDVLEPCGAAAQSILAALDGASEPEEKP